MLGLKIIEISRKLRRSEGIRIRISVADDIFLLLDLVDHFESIEFPVLIEFISLLRGLCDREFLRFQKVEHFFLGFSIPIVTVVELFVLV